MEEIFYNSELLRICDSKQERQKPQKDKNKQSVRCFLTLLTHGFASFCKNHQNYFFSLFQKTASDRQGVLIKEDLSPKFITFDMHCLLYLHVLVFHSGKISNLNTVFKTNVYQESRYKIKIRMRIVGCKDEPGTFFHSKEARSSHICREMIKYQPS